MPTTSWRGAEVDPAIDAAVLAIIERDNKSYTQAINEALADYAGVERPKPRRQGRPLKDREEVKEK